VVEISAVGGGVRRTDFSVHLSVKSVKPFTGGRFFGGHGVKQPNKVESDHNYKRV
jgi:hypothetical protein